MDHRDIIASLTPEQRDRLTEKSDARGLAHLAVHWGLIILLGALIALKVPYWWVLMLPQGILIVFLFTLLHEARPLLLNFGEAGVLDISPWAGRVRTIDASYAGNWELPVLGRVAPPGAVLVRPDGHVAWVGDGTPSSLADALIRWFGPPAQ